MQPRAVADEDGRFEEELVLAEAADELVVIARSAIGEEPALSPFGGPKLPDPLQCAWEALELPESGAYEGDVVLRVAPMPAAVQEKMGEVHQAHTRLEMPDRVGRRIGIPRKTVS